MPIDWAEVQRVLSPIKDYETLCRQWRESFSYPFVGQAYDFSMAQLSAYTVRLLGGDARQRYADYAAWLVATTGKLEQAGVQSLTDLFARVDGREKLEDFCRQSGLGATAIAGVMKYLAYWVIPKAKSLVQLVGSDPALGEAAQSLKSLGIRTNLDLLQRGGTAERRHALAQSGGLPEATLLELVNRADLSRLPWASTATIANIAGAGYGSLARLANADAQQLFADFFKYGESIGKDLRLGNEIESSQRIAKIVPVVLQ